MPAKLKVFRTTIGFHDAYVATPSRAAALRAWGATTDLFAMGAAEQVIDEKLMAAALATPGEVVRQSRGSEAEHLAAGGPARARAKSAPATKPKPRPSRAKLDSAEKHLAEAEARHAGERNRLEHEIAAIREREEFARKAFDKKRSKLDTAREAEANAYEDAMSKWREH